MTEKEKLIEQLHGGKEFLKNRTQDPNTPLNGYDCEYMLDIVEHINAAIEALERAIVPPVNENETVYIHYGEKVLPFTIININLYQNTWLYKGQHGLHLSYTFKTDDIGKTVFLTREAAEKALAERKKKPNCKTCSYVETTERGLFCCYFNGATQNENDWCYHYKESENNG